MRLNYDMLFMHVFILFLIASAPVKPGGNSRTTSSSNQSGTTTEPATHIPTVCKAPMGMQSNQIRDEMITASSFRDGNSSPEKARLNTNGFWMPATDSKTEYLQIDFLQQAYLTGISTQGRADAPTYVTSYKLQFSTDGINWNTYRENNAEKVGLVFLLLHSVSFSLKKLSEYLKLVLNFFINW